jgi:hypothetical protein
MQELCVMAMRAKNPFITHKEVLAAIVELTHAVVDPRCEIVQTLSGPDLALMWVFAKRDAIPNTEGRYTFDQLVAFYAQYILESKYQALARKQNYSRALLYMAFERLITCKLIRPITSLQSRSAKKVTTALQWPVAATLPVQELRDALQANPLFPTWMSF